MERSDNRIHSNPSSPPETDADVAPLIQKVGAPSLAQIGKVIGELHEARNLLESERERIQRETVHYIKFTQMALAAVRGLSAILPEWRRDGHPLVECAPRARARDMHGHDG